MDDIRGFAAIGKPGAGRIPTVTLKRGRKGRKQGASGARGANAPEATMVSCGWLFVIMKPALRKI